MLLETINFVVTYVGQVILQLVILFASAIWELE